MKDAGHEVTPSKDQPEEMVLETDPVKKEPQKAPAKVIEKRVASKPQSKNSHTVFFSINGKPEQERQVTTAVATTFLKLARDRPQAYKVRLPENSLLKGLAEDYKCREC